MLRNGLADAIGLRSSPLWLRAVLFGLAFFVCAILGEYLSPRGHAYVSFWLPAGLFVAVLLLQERRDWPWLILAGLPANVCFDVLKGVPWYLGALFYVGNTVQAVLGAWLVERFVVRRPAFRTVKEFFGYLGLAGILATLPGAALGAAALYLAGLDGDFIQSAKVWWGSCALAILMFSPLVLMWCQSGAATMSNAMRSVQVKPRKIIEGIVLYLGLIIGTWFIFVSEVGVTTPYKFRTLPLLLWAGLSFGRRGAAAANFIYAAIVVYGATHVTFSSTGPEELIFTTQTFLVVAAVVGLVPAIALVERDETLKQLRESETHYRHLTEAAFEGVCISEDGVIRDTSDQLLTMGGYQRNEVVGKPLVDFVEEASQSAVRDAVRTEREAMYRVRLRCKDGRFLDCEVRAKVVKAGERTVRMTALRDVSERLKAEAALHEKQRVLTTLMGNLPGLVYRCRDDADWTMEFASEGCHALTGYRPEDLEGNRRTSFGIMIHAEDRERLQQTVAAALERRAPFEVNYRIRTAIGELKWVWERGQGVFAADGKLLALEGFITDVTAQRKAEAEREAAMKREQEARNEFTRQLIASQEAERTRIAREIHDHLGQLLTALKLDLHALERRSGTLGDPEMRLALTGKIDSAKGLADETITSVQKIASELRPGILDRLGLAAAIEVEVQAFEERTGVNCRCVVPKVGMSLSQERATAMFRIFQEIITNIARHAQASVVQIELRIHPEALELIATDNGVGLSADQLQHPKSLGLLGMRERAEILGGHIEFTRPSTGQGTLVTVRIPLGEA